MALEPATQEYTDRAGDLKRVLGELTFDYLSAVAREVSKLAPAWNAVPDQLRASLKGPFLRPGVDPIPSAGESPTAVS